MASYVDWDKIDGARANGSDKFLKLEANASYTVRLIKRPVSFFKYTIKRNNKIFTAITNSPNDCPVKERHPELNKASFRLAVLVLHREDGNKLKILEGPRQMFENFKMYQDMVGIDPGSNESGDFKIKVVCPSGKKDKDTKYQVTPIKEKSKTPFTQEEIAYIKENIKNYNLEQIFAYQTPEEIEKKLFSSGEKESPDPNDTMDAKDNKTFTVNTREVGNLKVNVKEGNTVAKKDDTQVVSGDSLDF